MRVDGTKVKNNQVRFIYKSDIKHDKSFETLIKKVIELVRQIHVLPNNIEIQFEDMGPNVYGMTMLDPRFPNRIRLNQQLDIQEIVIPLTHELMHLHQTFTNRLQCRTGGKIVWENQIYKVNSLTMSHEEYLNLPWELDANEKQNKLLKFITQKTTKSKTTLS
jgi:hypothetical protein